MLVFSISFLLCFSNAQDEVSDQDVYVCYAHLYEKMVTLNGAFLNQEQSIDLGHKASDMYLSGMTLEDIAGQMRTMFQDVLMGEQADKFAQIYNQCIDILGSKEAAEELMKRSMDLSINFISSDKAMVDAEIAVMRGQGASTNALKRRICQLMYELITLEKKQALSRQLLAIVPDEKREALKGAMGQIIKLDDI